MALNNILRGSLSLSRNISPSLFQMKNNARILSIGQPALSKKE